MSSTKLSARSQRRARAAKILDQMRAERAAAGLSPLSWREDPMVVIFVPFLTIGLASSLGYIVATALPAVAGIGIGIALVVAIGAGGLVMRGFGELKGSPRLKAIGYFLGAGAYAATAVIALVNGVRVFTGG